MEEYLKETEFAVDVILKAIWHEHSQLENINSDMARLFNINWNKLNPENPLPNDLSKIGKVRITGMHPGVNATQEEELLYLKRDELKILESKILSRHFSIDALCGTLLQFAKQGISVVHRGHVKCPEGRMIGSQALKIVIWNGRNQSLHWEEGVNMQVRDCFRQLVKEFGVGFAEFNSKNLGSLIIGILGWRNFGDFERDMLLLK